MFTITRDRAGMGSLRECVHRVNDGDAVRIFTIQGIAYEWRAYSLPGDGYTDLLAFCVGDGPVHTPETTFDTIAVRYDDTRDLPTAFATLLLHCGNEVVTSLAQEVGR
jgi:hypothetical protein